MAPLTKDQITGINAEVDAATPKLDAFIESEAGMFAGSIERDVASQKGQTLIEGIIQSALLRGYDLGLKAAAATRKTATGKSA